MSAPRVPVLPHVGLALCAALGLTILLAQNTLPEVPFTGDEGKVRAERAYGDLPLAFEPNAGRSDPGLLYSARSESGTVFLTDEGATLVAQGKRESEAISLRPLGADLGDAAAQKRLPGVVSDLRGDDPGAWERNIPTFERIRYPNAYPGIDLDFRGSDGLLEYDFRLAPRAHPSEISFKLAGADSVRLAPEGDLIARSGEASFRHKAPVAYQPSPDGRSPVESSFFIDGRTVSFDLGAYDRERPLVIDPLALTYSTYVGGDVTDAGSSIAVDSAGAAYITGTTNSTDFDTVGQIEGPSGSDDVFVSKLTPAGSTLAYSTYLGGSAFDQGQGIAVDAAGAAYITGVTTSNNFNTVGQIEGDSVGDDAFVAKLIPAGNSLSYSTYLGGAGGDEGKSIAVDADGAAYVTGSTTSTDFDTVGQIEGDSAAGDAFVSKLTPTGNALSYSTYLGGGSGDSGNSIAVDADGAAYVTGDTSSTDFDTVGPIEGDSTAQDVFVSKLTPAGNTLSYSTYLGGGANDFANSIAVDGTGAAYVTGQTVSTDFDTVGQIEGDSAADDAFVSKLSPAGSALVYSTYLGGSASDNAKSIAVDAAGAAYVTGQTVSTDFNTVGQIEGDSASADAFVSKLTPAGSALVYSTYLGGGGSETANGIAVDGAGSAYATGSTTSTDFDTAGPIEGDSAGTDVFVSKLDGTGPETAITSGPKSKIRTRKSQVSVGFSFFANEPSLFSCKLDSGAAAPCTSPKRYTVGRGTHTFTVTATDTAGNVEPTPAVRSFKVVRKR